MANSIWEDVKYNFKQGDNIVTKIIAINIAVFIFVNLVRLIFFLIYGPNNILLHNFLGWLSLPADLKTLLFRPWTLITYMFLHVDFWHIIINMLIFYWFGNMLCNHIGNKKITPVYILGGLCGGLFYLMSYNIFPVFQDVINEAMVLGASAGVLAVLVATTTLAPNQTISLMFLGAIRIKYIALFLIILDIISIPKGNPGGHIAHLGGALFGYIYIKQLQKGNDLGKGLNKILDDLAVMFLNKQHMKVKYKSTKTKYTNYTDNSTYKEKKIDDILDKIAKSGYDSLTKEEKDFLFRSSKKE